MTTQAMVLAAGLGTRMMPLTRLLPKPALPVLNRPLIAWILDHLAAQGVTFAIVNSHHLPERLEAAAAHAAPAAMTVEFSREAKKILGTAGGLRQALPRFRTERLLLVNSDSLTDVDLAAAGRAHEVSGRAATMIVKEHDPAEGYRPVLAAPDPDRPGGTARVTGLAGRRWGTGRSLPRTFTGIHILEPGLLGPSVRKGQVADIVSDVYAGLLDKDEGSVGAWLHTGWWFEAGTPARYLDLNLAMLARSGRPATIAPGFFLDEEARLDQAIVGVGARLEGGCHVRESVLWQDVAVGPRARLRRCIVTEGVTVPAGAVFEETILMRGDDGGIEAVPMRGGSDAQ